MSALKKKSSHIFRNLGHPTKHFNDHIFTPKFLSLKVGIDTLQKKKKKKDRN